MGTSTFIPIPSEFVNTHSCKHFKTRQEFQSECNLLCQLPIHENIIRMWAFFYDRATPDISPQFSRMGENARAVALFLLMDEHPTNMMEYVGLLVNDQGPEVRFNSSV